MVKHSCQKLSTNASDSFIDIVGVAKGDMHGFPTHTIKPDSDLLPAFAVAVTRGSWRIGIYNPPSVSRILTVLALSFIVK